MLKEVNENYKRVEGLAGYVHWVSTAEELSDESLKEAYEETGNECMRKALAWSELVNGSMSFMHGGEVQAFEGVHEVLGEIAKMADIAVVSAGGSAEVQKDWEENGLDSYVEEFLTQEGGEKDVLVEKLLECGYDKDHVLMIGDAPSDLEAAGRNRHPVLSDSGKIRGRVLEKISSGSLGEIYRSELSRYFPAPGKPGVPE